MSYICDNCGKSVKVGRSGRHGRGVSGKRWKNRAQVTSKTFKPNIQKITMLIKGKRKQLQLCAKCLKRLKKDGKLQSFANVAFA